MESTIISKEERERRENCLRAYNRPREAWDVLTWSYPAKTSIGAVAFSVFSMYIHNLWAKKPWYFAAYARGACLVGVAILGYGTGALREYNYRTRDAVIYHYMELHPKDFERVKDFYGRPFSMILMPWIPFRTHQWDFKLEDS